MPHNPILYESYYIIFVFNDNIIFGDSDFADNASINYNNFDTLL